MKVEGVNRHLLVKFPEPEKGDGTDISKFFMDYTKDKNFIKDIAIVEMCQGYEDLSLSEGDKIIVRYNMCEELTLGNRKMMFAPASSIIAKVNDE